MRQSKSIFNNIDWVTILLYLLLVIMGWVNIYAAVYDDSHKSIFDISQRYGKQLIWIAAAIILGLIILALSPPAVEQVLNCLRVKFCQVLPILIEKMRCFNGFSNYVFGR